MSFFKKLFGHDDTRDAEKELSSLESAAASSTDEDSVPSPEIVAVIMAAVMNMMASGVSSDLRIKSIKRIGLHSPVWNTAGRSEYIASKL
jgi:hypothetical protein